eukprot:TRINITY_DN125_c0_g1_i4.p1 TRINITY_DN125_c0_g1~~TRINITY_DN125_c0_g1_i4.p1  ORF type:complete len:204 (+),score=44.69 TRINITY_DN125_c0_g1_i4:548-1159(+)
MADQPVNRFSAVCVFCGSKAGANEQFATKAAELGAEMLRRGLSLTYGGGTVGLMGVIANTIHSGGGKVVGFIPGSLSQRELSGENIGQTHVVRDMHTRKKQMFEHSDAFIAMPGGFGTFEELLEVITWQQLGIHRKPIGILNVAGFYDPLIEMVSRGHQSGFISDDMATRVLVVSSEPAELLDRLAAHEPPVSPIKWIDETQI